MLLNLLTVLRILTIGIKRKWQDCNMQISVESDIIRKVPPSVFVSLVYKVYIDINEVQLSHCNSDCVQK